MKTKLQLLSFFFTLLFMVSCGTDDPKKNGEKAGECKCSMYEMSDQFYDLQEDLLKTYEKKKRKVKNPDFGEEEWEEEYIFEKEVDDWEEYARIQLEMIELGKEYRNLEEDSREYAFLGYKASDNQDDYDEWIEEFEEEIEDYIEDNCEDAEDDLKKIRTKYREKENNYFDDTEEDKGNYINY